MYMKKYEDDKQPAKIITHFYNSVSICMYSAIPPAVQQFFKLIKLDQSPYAYQYSSNARNARKACDTGWYSYCILRSYT